MPDSSTRMLSASARDPDLAAKHSAMWVALVLAIALRALYTGLGALSAPYLLVLPQLVRSNRFAEHLIAPSAGLAYSLLGVWQKFDTLAYLHIAQFGYDRPSLTVFCPLYPLLIRVFTPVFGPMLAALVIASVAAFFLFWGLLLAASLDVPRPLAIRAVVFYALWPASFMLFCGYADSLVLALIVWTIYFARTDRWWLAGVLGGLAPLAKAVGILVIPVLLVLAIGERRRRNLWAALPLLGAAVYPLWLRLSGRIQPAQSYAQYWDTKVSFPWTTISHCLQAAVRFLDFSYVTNSMEATLQAGSALLYLSVSVWVLAVCVLAFSKKIHPGYPLYSLAAILIIVTKDSSIPQQSWTRYALLLFPAAIAFSLREQDRLLFVGSTALAFAFNLLLMWLFLQWLLVV